MTNHVTNPKSRLFFKKQERIKSRQTFQQLFQAGNTFKSHGLKFVYKFQLEGLQEFPAMLAFAVPKKYCKKAVRRNQIKRKIRESFRLSKLELWAILKEKKICIQLICIYSSSDVPHIRIFQKAFEALYNRISTSI